MSSLKDLAGSSLHKGSSSVFPLSRRLIEMNIRAGMTPPVAVIGALRSLKDFEEAAPRTSKGETIAFGGFVALARDLVETYMKFGRSAEDVVAGALNSIEGFTGAASKSTARGSLFSLGRYLFRIKIILDKNSVEDATSAACHSMGKFVSVVREGAQNSAYALGTLLVKCHLKQFSSTEAIDKALDALGEFESRFNVHGRDSAYALGRSLLEAHIAEKLSATDATEQAVAGLGLFTGAMNQDGADSGYVYAKRLFTEGLKNKKLAVNCAIDEAITTLKSETSG